MKVSAIIATLVALSLAACGSGSGTTSNGPTEAEQEAKAQAAADECEQQVGELSDTLNDLDSRLTVGLTSAQYSRAVADAFVAYDEVKVGQMSQGCLRVGAPLETALNRYAQIETQWSNCIVDFSCKLNPILADASIEWVEIEALLQKSDQAFNALTGGGSGSPVEGSAS